MSALVVTALLVLAIAGVLLAAIHHQPRQETTMPEPTERIQVDFGDLLIAVADDLDHIRQCVGCGEPSTWAGIFVSDDGLVGATAWCDASACEHDRLVLSAGRSFALPINHMPTLRAKAGTR